MAPLFSARGEFSDDHNHGLRMTTVPHKSCASAAAVNGSADYGHDINARIAFFGTRTKTAHHLISLHLYSAPSHSVRTIHLRIIKGT